MVDKLSNAAPRLMPKSDVTAKPAATSTASTPAPANGWKATTANQPKLVGRDTSLAPAAPKPAPITGAAVKKMLIDDNAALVHSNPAGAKEKFDKLKQNPFVFFRGTGALFYRDLKGTDANQPKVTCNGDVHPENFGVIADKDGKLSFGLNDFDESEKAPFTYDLKRGVTAFELASREKGLSTDDRAAVNKAFVDGYADAIKGFVGNHSEDKPLITDKNAKDYGSVVAGKLDEAAGKSREKFLEKRVDVDKQKFLNTDEIKPCSERLPEFKTALASYAKSQGFSPDDIKDVAIKNDSGTASLGSQRYYVLVADPAHGKDRILEVKQEKASVMEAAGIPNEGGAPADRVVKNEQLLSPNGDPYYGSAKLGGESFLVRERAPSKDGVTLATDKMSPKELKDYAGACGAALALAHARSASVGGEPAEKAVDRALDKDLKQQIEQFGVSEADHVTEQYKAFKAD